MSALWHKLWADLWHEKGRVALAVLSIAAGVFAVGAIFGMIDQLQTGMDEAHQAVRPTHMNIILRGLVDQETVDRLKNVPGVDDIDPLNQLSVRYKVESEEEWRLGTLVMRPDYQAQNYDLLALTEGQWPQTSQASATGLAIERLSGQYYDLALSDEVIFEIGDEEQSLSITGQIRHPFVQPPLFGGQAHFFTDSAGLAEFGIPEGLFGQLLVRVTPYSPERAREVADEIRARLGQQGVGVAVTLYQDPFTHWGRMFVDGINLVLQIMAIVSLFMSVVLILNSTMAVITQQTDQIGVIKAVGGGRGAIVKLYLGQLVVYGLLALAIALPLAATFAFFMSRWFLNLFNIDYATFQLSSTALALQVVAALAAPLLAGLWPVLKGASITVREAIATYGLGADFGSSRFDRLVERIGAAFLPASFAATLGNVFRRKGRLAMTLAVLIVGGVMYLVVMTLISSTNATLDNEMARQKYDLRIGFSRDVPAEEILSAAAGEASVEDGEVWYSRNATLARDGVRLQDSAGLGAQLVGLPESSAMYRPIITAGRWLEEGDERVVVVSQETADANGLQVGDSLTVDLGELGTAEWQIVGAYRLVYGNGYLTEAIYAPQQAVYRATGQRDVGTQIVVRSDASTLAESRATADALKERFKENGLPVDIYTTSIKLEERQFADNQFGSVTSMLLGLAFLVAVVGGIGLMGSLGISVIERRREIGVMRAVGAQSRTILSLFVMEGGLQGFLSWLIAFPLALMLARPLARQLGQTMIEVDLDYVFNWSAVLIWLVTVTAIALVSSILPARKATQVSVRESLAFS
ncbi:MAG: ABC transporter permease [Chloroflexota bacterium]|jgi:putative ABC transport system permease protein